MTHHAMDGVQGSLVATSLAEQVRDTGLVAGRLPLATEVPNAKLYLALTCGDRDIEILVGWTLAVYQHPIGRMHNGGSDLRSFRLGIPDMTHHALAQNAEERPETVVTGNRELQPERLGIKGSVVSHRRPVFYSEIRSNNARARSQSAAI